MRNVHPIGSIGILFCALMAQASSAAVIPSLFNTGVVANDANGQPTSVILDNAPDPHYQLVGVPGGETDPPIPTQAIVVIQGQFPFVNGPAVWAPDTATSKWIAPHGNENRPEAFGNGYDYRTSFDLTGFDPASARIQGNVYADNLLTGIEINGVLTGISGATFTSGMPFAISSGFISGMNTLDFLVQNNNDPLPNPTGVRVEMTGTATPEPGACAVALSVMCGFLLLRRRPSACAPNTQP